MERRRRDRRVRDALGVVSWNPTTSFFPSGSLSQLSSPVANTNTNINTNTNTNDHDILYDASPHGDSTLRSREAVEEAFSNPDTPASDHLNSNTPAAFSNHDTPASNSHTPALSNHEIETLSDQDTSDQDASHTNEIGEAAEANGEDDMGEDLDEALFIVGTYNIEGCL